MIHVPIIVGAKGAVVLGHALVPHAIAAGHALSPHVIAGTSALHARAIGAGLSPHVLAATSAIHAKSVAASHSLASHAGHTAGRSLAHQALRRVPVDGAVPLRVIAPHAVATVASHGSPITLDAIKRAAKLGGTAVSPLAARALAGRAQNTERGAAALEYVKRTAAGGKATITAR